MKKCLAVLLALVSGGAVANSACDKSHNDFDGPYCPGEVFQQADADLNTAYQSLSAKFDSAGKAALKQGRTAWVGSRNSHGLESRDGAFRVDGRCGTYTTVKRAEFPQDRDRECASSGCQNGKLSFS